MKTLVYFVLLLISGTISCRQINHKADAYGNFEAIEIMVKSETAGRILSFNVLEGDRIDSGFVVATIDDTLLILQRQQLIVKTNAVLSQKLNLKAQQEVLNTQLKASEKELVRIENLFKNGAATQKQLDEMKSATDILRKQIEVVQTQQNTVLLEADVLNLQIDQIDVQIQRSKVINPTTGYVLVKYAEKGELANIGTALVKVGDLDILYLRAFVSGDQLTEIDIGQQVRVKVDAPEGQLIEYPGNITWISATAEFTPKIVQTREERVNLVYAVKIRVNNYDGNLKIGMPGEVFFN